MLQLVNFVSIVSENRYRSLTIILIKVALLGETIFNEFDCYDISVDRLPEVCQNFTEIAIIFDSLKRFWRNFFVG